MDSEADGRRSAVKSWLLRRSGVVALAATAVAALGVAAPGAARQERPVVTCPDPTLLVDRGHSPHVTLMCTGPGYPTRSAGSVRGLAHAHPHAAFAADGWPAWADGGWWAPDVEKVGRGYRMYFSAKRRGDGRRVIGVATSDRPDGGFRDVGAPIVTDEADGAIDPSLLRDRGRLFLLYKRDGNARGHASVIYGRRLSRDGRRVTSDKVALLRNRRGSWEHAVAEGPTAVHRGNTTTLVYSGGYFGGPGYAEGEATRRGWPLGRYHRVSLRPVVHGQGKWWGTGGGSVVRDGTRLLLAYNAFPHHEQPAQRRLFVRPLRWDGRSLQPAGQAERVGLGN
jgi:hypothetical protein